MKESLLLLFFEGTLSGAHCRFMIDTGASYNYLSSSFADYHGIERWDKIDPQPQDIDSHRQYLLK